MKLEELFEAKTWDIQNLKGVMKKFKDPESDEARAWMSNRDEAPQKKEPKPKKFWMDGDFDHDDKASKFVEPIELSQAEVIKLAKAAGESLGKVTDTYPESQKTKTIDGKKVAVAIYAVLTYDDENDTDHDPFYLKFWRDPKNASRILGGQFHELSLND